MACVGAVGPSTIHQEALEESHPIVYWLRGIQTSVSAMNPAVTHKLWLWYLLAVE